MRNLKLQYCKILENSLSDVQFFLINPNLSGDEDIFYAATKSALYCINSSISTKLLEVPGIISAEYLALDNEICLATEVGEILIVNLETLATREGTYCEVGIELMSWSPDQEVVAFVTKTKNIVVMTCTYEVIAEYPLADENSGQEFVNVGWGKKETQFHGSEGKTAAQQANTFELPTNINELPDRCELSWREDGAYFAVSFLSTLTGRTFKVFNREGSLQHTCENINNLSPPIAWRPLGTWIAIPQLLPNKSTVALFEKNGLRHREIVMPFDFNKEFIASMRWNTDSEILTIETYEKNSGFNNLYLYTIGNYHWYLKQKLKFQLNDPINVYSWDNRIGIEKTLHVLLKSGKHIIYRWHYGIDKCQNIGVVAVIDGNKLLLNDFSKSVVPPPMCNKELQIVSEINACGFIALKDINDNCQHNSEIQLFILDSNDNLHLFKSEIHNILNFKLINTLKIFNDVKLVPLQMGNMLWYNEHQLVAATITENCSKIQLVNIKADPAELSDTLLSSHQVDGIIKGIWKGAGINSKLFIHNVDGNIQSICFTQDLKLDLKKTISQFEQPIEQLLSYSSPDSKESMIILDVNRSLYVNSMYITDDVTSCCLAGNYLVFTKLTALQFLNLYNNQIISERKIERGGKLISIIPTNARTVLQMPRGNLEAITPRLLSLEIIGELLKCNSYNKAMELMRKQRINLNIICDYNINEFLNNLNLFVKDISDPNWLNLFINDLRNEDLTKTMYADSYKGCSQSYPSDFSVENKVAYICNKLCETMEKETDRVRYQLPILTAYIKLGQIKKALELVWEAKKAEILQLENGVDKNVIKSHMADYSLRYLLYLVEVNTLYNVALSTYDFGLVLFVAERSQKDPKEFLPFLNELRVLEENYRKFKIDEHLRFYPSALTHIAKCCTERFSEALAFINKHKLHREAINCFPTDFIFYKDICLCFGDYLRSNGKLENASIMYERGGNLQQALLSARNCGDYERVLALAHNDPTQNVQQVALSLVPILEQKQQFIEAFNIIKNYSNNIKDGLQCLLRGKLYLRAILESRIPQQDDTTNDELLNNIVKPDLMAYVNNLMTTVIKYEETYVEYTSRLFELRLKQTEDPHKLKNDYFEVDEADVLSETSSMNSYSRYSQSSRGTGKTFSSSKNRRKHQRKLFSLKPRNPFEDIALIDALYNHIIKVFGEQKHIGDICKALLIVKEDQNARELQTKFKKVLSTIKDSADKVWTMELAIIKPITTGPNTDYKQLQNEQRFALLDPFKRFKPEMKLVDWEHEILF